MSCIYQSPFAGTCLPWSLEQLLEEENSQLRTLALAKREMSSDSPCVFAYTERHSLDFHAADVSGIVPIGATKQLFDLLVSWNHKQNKNNSPCR